METDKKKFARLNKILNGSDGVVYLLFVGRETYAAKVQNRLVGTIYKHGANTNQAIERLLKHQSEFLVFKNKQREEGSRGREADIYSANLEPIFLTLKSLGVEFNQRTLQLALESLAEGNDYFPNYLTNMFDVSVIRTFSWNSLLSLYLFFVVELLKVRKGILYPMPEISNRRIIEEKVALISKDNPTLKDELISWAMQLSSPSLKLNPQFKEQITKGLKGLENLENIATGLMGFLVELQKLGFKDFSELESKFKEGLEQIQKAKLLVEKAEALTAKIEKDKKRQKKLA